jgi:methyl-accepting chemotaxis protein
VLSRLRLRAKIWLAISVIILGYLFSLLLSYSVQRQTEEQLLKVSASFFPASKSSQQVYFSFRENVKLYQDAVMTGELSLIEQGRDIASEINLNLENILKLPAIRNTEHYNNILQLKENFQSYTETACQIYTSMASFTEVPPEKTSQLAEQTNYFDEQFQGLQSKFEIKLQNSLTEVNLSMEKQIFWSIFLFICILILSFFLISGMISKTIITPIKQFSELISRVQKEGNLNIIFPENSQDEIGDMARTMNSMISDLNLRATQAMKVAEGNLNCEIKSAGTNDSLGNAVSLMVERLGEIILNVQNIADEISSGSESLFEASRNVSDGSINLAASLQELTSSSVELVAQANCSAENSTQANLMSTEAKKTGEQSRVDMNDLKTAMEDIKNSSEQIRKIIKVIDDIAFQTNLLALNAAVEAARAGKHGKGFAVVAEEVRNLAARSAKAAKETEQIISQIAEKIHSGVIYVERTHLSLNNIVEQTDKLALLIEEINSTNREQAIGVESIRKNLCTIEELTQSAAANAEETASTAGILAGKSTDLHKLSQYFQTN